MMSSKAASKIKRGSSGTMPSALLNKKKQETPEESVQATPSASMESMSVEKEQASYIDVPLEGEEISALAVNPDDLIKLHPPRPPSINLEPPAERKKVMVKRTMSPSSTKRKSKKVGVLHPLPPGTSIPVSKQLTAIPPGPRFDEEGTFLAHSILGSVDNFASELKQRKLITSTSDFIRPPPIIIPKISKPTEQEKRSVEESATPPKEKHALGYWKDCMDTRKVLQDQLSMRMDVFPENLAMNQGDTFRQFQEERIIIDRSIPPVKLNDGKGYRRGSEFWSQQERLGDEDSGIHFTLTKSEQGLTPELEYIGVPSVVLKEKGIDCDSGRAASIHYARRKTPSYLVERREQLKEVIEDFEHFRPDISELQVVGRGLRGSKVENFTSGHATTPMGTESSRFRMRTDSLDSSGEEKSAESAESSSENKISESKASTGKPPVGPILRVAENILLEWTGPPLPPSPPPSPPLNIRREVKSDTSIRTSTRKSALLHPELSSESHRQLFRSSKRGSGSSWGGGVGGGGESLATRCRVLLEGSTGEIALSCLKMENCGSTVIYYSWRPIAKPNPLGTVSAGTRQRFYFDTRGGVLLPGESLDFPFHFKSPNPGIFSETWRLTTAPALNRGRPLLVTLKGVATQEDLYQRKRDEIECMLVHREAVAAAERIVERLVNSIRTPPSSPPRRVTIVSEEDIFKEKNPDVYFHYDIIQQLKNLHDTALYPDLFQESSSLQPPSFSGKGGGKKSEEKSGGTSKKGKEKETGTGKEKKAPKPKAEEPAVEAQTPQPEVPVDLVKWDLSIDSLLEIIMSVEEDASREEKLKQLSHLVGELSFPPLLPIKRSNYHICYMCLCEAVDYLSDTSTQLCQVMGLPSRDWADRFEKKAGGVGADGGGGGGGGASGGGGGEDSNILAVPGSPGGGHGKSKDKRSSVNKEKKKGSSKERQTGTPTHKSKKVSKASSTSPKGTESQELPETTSVVEVDPIMERKYKENLYVKARRILELAVDKMVLMMESEKSDFICQSS